jgi:hypothetical protein
VIPLFLAIAIKEDKIWQIIVTHALQTGHVQLKKKILA